MSNGGNKVGAVLIILAVVFGLAILFILTDAKKTIKDVWNMWTPNSAVVEPEESDSLFIEYIGPRYSSEKEAQIRQLNEHMSEFLNVEDIE